MLEKHGGDTSLLDIVKLDLLSDDGWREAINGHSHLIHAASPFVTIMPNDPQVLVKPAIEGTVRALNAGLSADVYHIVLTSSIVAVAYGRGSDKSQKLSEKNWTNIDGKDVNAYVLSKTLAERRAWELVEEVGKKNLLTVINPGMIFGPLLDDDVGTSGDIIFKMLKGVYPGSPNLGFSSIDVRDVAQIHINALDNKEFAGQRCIATGPPIQIVEIARILAREFPTYTKKLPTRLLPDFLVRLVGLFDGDTRTAANSLGDIHDVDNRRAITLLGRQLIPQDDAIIAMANSVIDQGLT